MGAAKIDPANWAEVHYRSAREAILDIDLTVQANPADATNIIGSASTALIILCDGAGVVDPRWLSLMGRFSKLTRPECRRVADALDMRSRALSRVAA